MALRATLDKDEDRSRFVGEYKREAAIFTCSTLGATVHIPFALGVSAASDVMFPNSTLRCPGKKEFGNLNDSICYRMHVTHISDRE